MKRFELSGNELIHLKEMCNSSKIQPLDYEIKSIAQLRKLLRKMYINTHATISGMLVCQFVYAEALFDFEG